MELNQKVLKGYELKERLGAGGFGAVYRAYQSTIGREVAVKIILPSHSNQPEFIRRFEGEAQVVARLEHPHITPLYDYWRDPEGAYLVMRWLRGGSLKEAIEKDPFDLRAAANLLEQIAGALSLAHRNGIIHRDIKPANILLDEDGNAYLTDFGIAKDLNLPNGGTQTDAIVGSLDYISPEQARSEPVTSRTDIYSLGVTLYEVITGSHPFVGLSPIERLYKHINEALPEITGLEPDKQEAINSIIQKATQKNPDNRYPDALAFAADFREAIGLNRASTTVVELLTIREQEILQLIIEGLANKEIAQKLTVTLGTVKWYVKQIYDKLGVRSRVQAMVRARELNLVVKGATIVAPIEIPTEDFQPTNPYKGLLAFQAGDNQDFFGREKLTAKLLKRMGESSDYQRFLAVIGPSGSGKSSVVKAGLIPALWRGELPKSESWFIVEMIPGARPLDELEIALMKLAANQGANLHEQLSRDAHGLLRIASLILPNDASELLIVIDQFEEVFTLVEDEALRQQFLNLLYASVSAPRSRVRIVITMRADFYDRPLYYPDFGELVRNRLETIMPLSSEELESAIRKPAERVGVGFEEALIATIVGDVNYQAGALPLLQYALTELFEQRKGHFLTREAYQAIGRATGALAKRAEEIYLGLTDSDRELSRQIFLRLVTLGEGTEDTRRRTLRSELLGISEDMDAVEELLDGFAAYRLLSLDNDAASRQPTVEIAHEALIREWERLKSWLNESRSEIQMQRQLSSMAKEWVQAKENKSFLLRGSRLENFEFWAKETTFSLTPQENVFLQSSLKEREKEEAAERERQVREQFLEKRSQTFLRVLVAVFALASLLSGGLAFFAFDREGQAQEARATSDANFARAEQQRLALLANDAMDNGASGNVGFALALRSLEYGYSAEADRAILRASRQGIILRELERHPVEVYAVRYSPDGLVVATASEGGTRLSNPDTGDELLFLSQDGNVHFLAFSPDSEILATVNSAEFGVVRLWNVETGAEIRHFEHNDQIWFFKFSSDSNEFAVRSENSITIWNLFDGTSTVYPVAIDDQTFRVDMYYTSDSELQFLFGDSEHFYSQNPETGQETCKLVETPREAYAFFAESSYYPLVVLWTNENIAYVWDIATCTLLSTFAGHTEPINWADIDVNGKFVVTGDVDGLVLQWDVLTGEELGSYQINSFVRGFSISPDSRQLAISDWDETFIWDMETIHEPRAIVTEFAGTFSPRFNPDGNSILVGGFGNPYALFALDSDLRTPIFSFEERSRLANFSPDGRLLAIGNDEGMQSIIFIMNAHTGEVILATVH